MSITDKTGDVLLFTPGRTPCTGPLAIVLHGYSSGIEMLDLEMERCPRPRPRQSTGCHTSFHYGVDGCNIHQYVALANTAWGFGVTPPTCPAPICPPDECSSCTGLTVAQYNPDLDGNDPVLPPFVAGTDGTANSCVIHVAVTGQSGFSALDAYGDCCRWMEKSYQCFVRSLCEIFRASGLTPSQTTLLVHCQELLCINIDQLVIDILACLNAPAPVLPPCNCTATTISPDALCAALDTLPTSIVPAVLALGTDCAFHPVTDVNVLALDTSTINTTVTEAPPGTFTVSADLVAIPSLVLCSALDNLPTGAPVEEGTELVGVDCATHAVVFTNIVAQDSASVDLTITESTPDNFEILADVNISATVDNALVLNIDGLYTPTAQPPVLDCLENPVVADTPIITKENLTSALAITGAAKLFGLVNNGDDEECPGALSPVVCSGAVPTQTGDVVLGTRTDGRAAFVRLQRIRDGVLVLLDPGTITQALLDTNNAATVLVATDVDGAIVIEPPSVCQGKHLWIKNLTDEPLTVSSSGGELIDGVVTITLDGTIPAGYPFGNNGGESVHLVYDNTNTQWYVV